MPTVVLQYVSISYAHYCTVCSAQVAVLLKMVFHCQVLMRATDAVDHSDRTILQPLVFLRQHRDHHLMDVDANTYGHGHG